MNRGPALKLFWVFLTGILVGQLFFVRELLAGLALFAAAFIALAALGLALLLVKDAGERGMAWVETHAQTATQFLRRSPELVRELSRRPSHRPR